MLYSDYTKQQAIAKIPKRDELSIEAAEMATGDLWRNALGWIGQLPAEFAVQAEIAKALVSENVIDEAVSRHTGGVLGREPRWGLVQKTVRRLIQRRLSDQRLSRVVIQTTPDLDQAILDIEDPLTAWWDDRNILEVLQYGSDRVITEGRAPLRVFIPSGLRDEQGNIPRCATLDQALSYIYVDAPEPDGCGVYVDPDTRREIGVFSYKDDESRQCAEVTYKADDGSTVLRVFRGDDAPIDITVNLGGKLFVYEMQRRRLITRQIVQLQKAITLTLTQMMRNVNLAGSRERIFTNMQQPGEWVISTQGAPGAQKFPDNNYYVFVSAPYPTGAGVTFFGQGEEVRDKDGTLTGYANPNVNIVDPVDVETFLKTHRANRLSILNQAQQAHVEMAGDATASGKSREQARAEYESSLRRTKGSCVDDAGRWLLETVLALAGFLQGDVNLYAAYRVEFGAIINTGPLSPEERAAVREDYRAKLVSRETAMSRLGVEDVEAEIERIDREGAQPVEELIAV